MVLLLLVFIYIPMIGFFFSLGSLDKLMFEEIFVLEDMKSVYDM